MQDNFFFREPETQRMLLDILFIYAKLNPDLGYRQGMHELLAPLLWVVQQDAVDHDTTTAEDRQAEGFDFMTDVLDYRQREADAFSLFCAVMQTAKSFYEMGDNRDSSPIIARSRRIHDDLLSIFDPELALHLQVAGVLPQIYAIRWVRLLFGREFDFADVLRLWDIMFAEKLRSDIIDMTCVAMLLRMRWSLVEADYSTAITTLTHVKLPSSETEHDTRGLVRDALLLDQTRRPEIGAELIQKHSGRKPKVQSAQPDRARLSLDQIRTPERRGSRTPQYRPSPNLSPARFSGPQRQLESLFNDVSGGIKNRAEGWTSVSKAVRGAVGEVRRNMAQYQPNHSREASVDVPRQAPSQAIADTAEGKALLQKLSSLEERNKALAKMLESALESLRKTEGSNGSPQGALETFNVSLAKIQFVAVYLSDSDIPIPREEFSISTAAQVVKQTAPEEASTAMAATNEIEKVSETISSPAVQVDETASAATTEALSASEPVQKPAVPQQTEKGAAEPSLDVKSSPPTRPSLQDASFSFMLGENRHRSSFVTSVNALPEHQRRSIDQPDARPGSRRGSEAAKDSVSKGPTTDTSKQSQRPAKGKLKGKKQGNQNSDDEDGWRMSSFRGGQGGPL
jgi:TBC1 domain family member 5